MKKTYLLICLVISFLGCQKPISDEPFGIIEGKVLEINSLIPVKNIKVYLALPMGGIISTGLKIIDSTMTDLEGQYTFKVTNFFGGHSVGAYQTAKEYKLVWSDSSEILMFDVKSKSNATVQQNIIITPLSWVKMRFTNVNPSNANDCIECSVKSRDGSKPFKFKLQGLTIDTSLIYSPYFESAVFADIDCIVRRNNIQTELNRSVFSKARDTALIEIKY